MTILLRILVLLACLPQLQPPGFCVCEAVPRDVSRPARPPADGCHPNDADHDEPRPSEPPHSPGCPALISVDRSTWVEPASVLVRDLPPPATIEPPGVDRIAAPSLQFHAPANWVAAPPLYLQFCSLVI